MTKLPLRPRGMCRLMAVLSLAGAAALLVPLAAPGSAGAVAPAAGGYWVKLGAPVPTVPKGGLLVAADPTSATSPASPVGSQLPGGVPSPTLPGVPGSDVTGPAAISAVRVTGVGPGADVTLTLLVAPGSVVPPPSVTTVVACPLTQPLPSRPPQGGDIAKAPGYDCSSVSVGRVAGNQASISWLLPAGLQSTPGELDVALLPNPAGEPVAFSVAFSAPGASSVDASTGPPPPPPAANPPGEVATAPVASSPAPFLPTPIPGESGGSPIPLFAAPVTPPAPVAPSPFSGTATGGPATTRLAGAHLPGDDRAHRLLAVLVLLAMAVGWWYAGGQPARAPRLLGALGVPGNLAAAVRMGGIGRFARPRTSGPRRL